MMREGRTSSGRGRALVRLLVAGVLAVMSLPLLAGTASADDFSNTTPIVIPGPPPPAGCPDTTTPTNNSCPATTATLYPSPIAVSGLTGLITDVNVSLKGLTHNSPVDLDVMLQAPDGKTVMLMSDVCAAAQEENPITSAIDLTFDDLAANPVPADAACASGAFKPFDDDDDPEFQFTGADTFPAPAPATPPVALLSVFNTIDPNGTWNLWVVDDYPGDIGVNSGQFACGWTLSVATTATAANPTTPTPSSCAGQSSTGGPTGDGSPGSTAAARPAAATSNAPRPQSPSAARAANRATLADSGSSSQTLSIVAGLLMVSGLVLMRLAQPKTTWPRTARR